jgi:hypothetical protein
MTDISADSFPEIGCQSQSSAYFCIGTGTLADEVLE